MVMPLKCFTHRDLCTTPEKYIRLYGTKWLLNLQISHRHFPKLFRCSRNIRLPLLTAPVSLTPFHVCRRNGSPTITQSMENMPACGRYDFGTVLRGQGLCRSCGHLYTALLPAGVRQNKLTRKWNFSFLFLRWDSSLLLGPNYYVNSFHRKVRVLCYHTESAKLLES